MALHNIYVVVVGYPYWSEALSGGHSVVCAYFRLYTPISIGGRITLQLQNFAVFNCPCASGCVRKASGESGRESRSERSGTVASERPSVTRDSSLFIIVRPILFIALPFSLLHDHRLFPRPPAQDNCEKIEDLPALTIR